MNSISEPPRHEPGVLTSRSIIRELNAGRIRIWPFYHAHLGNCSYDVSLGPYVVREAAAAGGGIMVPWQRQSIARHMPGPQRLPKAPIAFGTVDAARAAGLGPDDEVLILQPGEWALGHTMEYIGAMAPYTTMLKARSSIARSCVSVCMCAGWGDIGYVNRWTLELKNHSQHHAVALVVGMRIAQVTFLQTSGDHQPSDNYGLRPTDKYQPGMTQSFNEIIAAWQPTQMLPRLDHEGVVDAVRRERANRQGDRPPEIVGGILVGVGAPAAAPAAPPSAPPPQPGELPPDLQPIRVERPSDAAATAPAPVYSPVV